MRIATWNIERLKHKKSLPQIVELCELADADILVLTETNNQILLKDDGGFHTLELNGLDPKLYGEYENRVSIYSNYECAATHETSNPYTSICVEFVTEKGNLLVYGTIIGAFGNRHPSFLTDLEKLEADVKRLSKLNKPICVIGDYNLSFCDNYYFTTDGRTKLQNLLRDYNVRVLTHSVPECIDHIAVSNTICGEDAAKITEWNEEKSLSDHKGIMVDF